LQLLHSLKWYAAPAPATAATTDSTLATMDTISEEPDASAAHALILRYMVTRAGSLWSTQKLVWLLVVAPLPKTLADAESPSDKRQVMHDWGARQLASQVEPEVAGELGGDAFAPLGASA
jgi:hypothetical protein